MIDDAIARTASNTRTTLVIALNYGSQAELADVARALADGSKAGRDRPGRY